MFLRRFGWRESEEQQGDREIGSRRRGNGRAEVCSIQEHRSLTCFMIRYMGFHPGIYIPNRARVLTAHGPTTRPELGLVMTRGPPLATNG